MKSKNKKILSAAFAALLIMKCTTPTFADEGGTNLLDVTFQDGESVSTVIYVYVENDAENPYNNPDRDVTVEFAGNGEYYIEGQSYHMQDDSLYKDYGIFRILCELPCEDNVYYPCLTADDVKATESMSYMFSLNSAAPMDIGTKGLSSDALSDGLNEFYFVGSTDHSWIDAEGEEKLMEMYQLLHSEEGSIHDNRLTNATVDEEVFLYWQKEMINDASIYGWQDDDGTVYTREDMTDLGYPVPCVEESAEATDDVASETSDTADHAEKTAESTETDAANGTVDTEKDTGHIPDLSEETNASAGVPPIVIVLVGAVSAVAAVIIAYIRRERNESDLYID